MKELKFRASRDMTVLELLNENNISSKIIKSLKAKGNILKDGKIIFLKESIKEGDFITLVFPDEKSDMNPVKMDIDVVYKDDNIMIINKAYGLSVMSTMNLKEDTLLNGIQAYLLENGLDSKIHIINRLDRNTTGLMAIALNRYSASMLSLDLKNNLKRKYYAIVKGILDQKEGTIINRIAKESNMTVRRCVRNDGKEAITNYKVVKEFNNYSLLDIELLTGRTHQIRVTFNEIGHPLVGDEMYDKDYIDKEEMMLHSHYIEFINPQTKEKQIIDIGLSKKQKDFIENIDKM